MTSKIPPGGVTSCAPVVSDKPTGNRKLAITPINPARKVPIAYKRTNRFHICLLTFSMFREGMHDDK